MDGIEDRAAFAATLCREAGERAKAYFTDRDMLAVDRKGAQDWVSEADRAVERLIRERLARDWPDDGIHGEEYGAEPGTSGFTWVIDPIDGTTNFLNGLPFWCVVLAGVAQGRTQIGVIRAPMQGETFAAVQGGGATLDGTPMRVADGTALADATVAVGYSNRASPGQVVAVVADLVERGAMFHRNASGALSLAYIAAGRLSGYLEVHMNAWDCLAGQLLIAEAGGVVEDQDANAMLRDGGRVVAGTQAVFTDLKAIADKAWQGA